MPDGYSYFHLAGAFRPVLFVIIPVIEKQILLGISRKPAEFIPRKKLHSFHVSFFEAVHVIHYVLYPCVNGKSFGLPESEKHDTVSDLGSYTSVTEDLISCLRDTAASAIFSISFCRSLDISRSVAKSEGCKIFLRRPGENFRRWKSIPFLPENSSDAVSVFLTYRLYIFAYPRYVIVLGYYE